uniref:RAP domain-containing protein n=1 Tax=Alexandrium monilatum TaxID=311494 RepID=A0A7S4QZ47_9DINO
MAQGRPAGRKAWEPRQPLPLELPHRISAGMARATWAAKAQLLGRLQPFAVAGTHCAGAAPLSLLPELCGHLRGFTPAELRLVLAAYAGHPPEVPALSQAAPSGGPQEAGRTRLSDVLVQLLVGGSRLGTLPQLLDAADAIASFAPRDCGAALEFWTVFAERIARLSAGNQLEPGQMLRIFQVCATWKQRCDPAQGSQRSGGAWGHMLRSVGGRLADPRHLDAMPLTDVVAVARYAARLGEPQLRLAAAVGLRVGGREAAASLSPEDLVDLIGAAGRLGGRLHMMTRALADELELQAQHLPTRLLLRLCVHLGALEMFPQRLAAVLEEALPSRVHELTTQEQLQLLRVSGRLRWRLPNVLEPLLESLRPEVNLDGFDGAELGALLYELYRLDLWDEELLRGLCERLHPDVGRAVPQKTAANALLALSYFSYPAEELYKRFVHELLRARDLPHEAVYQLKTFEMAVRVGHTCLSFESLGQLASRWLFGIRKTATPPEPMAESAFADDVSAVAQSIAWKHATEVEVGPYSLDFAGMAEGEDGEPPAEWDDNKPGRSLTRFCVALEADGPSHFYRPHGRPWHWTSTSKLRHRLLTAARIKVAHVPFYDWMQLSSDMEKEAYLARLLLRAQQRGLPAAGHSGAAGLAEAASRF